MGPENGGSDLAFGAGTMTMEAKEPPRSSGAPSLHDDVPPATLCVWCGRTDCEGCPLSERGPGSEIMPGLPWELTGGAVAWWVTCMRLTDPPIGWLDAVIGGRLGRAAWFALWAEIVAVTSYAAPLVAAGWALMALFGASSPALGVVVGTARVCIGLGVFMVALHIVWVAALEALLLARGGKAQWKPALLLGLYACGWDMVTSPAGVLLGWYSGGFGKVGRLLRGATANPKAACLHYLSVARQLAPRTALRLAMLAAAFAVMLGVVGAAGLLWWWDPQLWEALIAVVRFAVT